MGALTVARLTIKDPDKFKDYASKAPQTMEDFGAEFLFRGSGGKNLSGGGADHQVTVIYRFPSLEDADQWYASQAYQSLIALRDEAADIQIVSYELMG
jgi:uncharacterized protein (DUF1330 family)